MLYYIHGYLSNPDSAKGQLFKETLQAYPIRYRTCKPEEIVVSECLERISETIKEDKEVTLIGSSFGGYLAAETALNHDNIKTLFLLNPAIIPPHMDISTIHGMPERILRGMQDETLFTTKIPADIYIILGTEDEIVPNNWGITFAKAQEAHVIFLHDDHRFSENLYKLPSIISENLKIHLQPLKIKD